MSERMPVAWIGCVYGHQRDYGGALAAHPRMRLEAIAERTGALEAHVAAARALAAERGVPFYEDYREMLVKHRIAAASVALPPEHNVPVLLDLARRGVHVISEKPVAPSAAEIAPLRAALAETGARFTFAAPATVFSGAFRPAIEAVERGEIGEARTGFFQYLQTGGPEYTLPPERCREVKMAEFGTFAPYGVLAFRKLMRSDIVKVFARFTSAFYPHYRENGLEDMSLVSVTFANGAVGTLVVGRTTTKGMPQADVRMQVFGSQGALNINNGLGYAINQYRDGTHSKIPFGSSTTTLFIDDFVNAILEKRDPMVTCDDAMQTAAFLDASLASAHSGRVKSLN